MFFSCLLTETQTHDNVDLEPFIGAGPGIFIISVSTRKTKKTFQAKSGSGQYTGYNYLETSNHKTNGRPPSTGMPTRPTYMPLRVKARLNQIVARVLAKSRHRFR